MKTDGILLNMGAGPKIFHAPAPWVNIDSDPANEADLIADIRRLPVYTDGVVDAIYAGHVLEHLARTDVVVALAEWIRILKPNGRICVAGPDVDKGAVLFEAGKITRDRFLSLGTHASEEAIAAARAGAHIPDDQDPADSPAFHRWDCTAGAVMTYLDVAGFVDVTEVPMAIAPFDWPIYDRSMDDQFVVLARKDG